MVEDVRIGAGLLAELVSGLRAALPAEGCGLAAGRSGAIERLYPLPNAAASGSRYEADAAAQLRAYEAMTAEGLEPVAVYHSHPASPARPSATDIALADVGSVYLIVSLAAETPEVRAWRIRDGVARELELRIEGSRHEPAFR